MPRNIEIKARIDSVEAWAAKVEALAGSGPTRILQDDTFFNCPTGRLKLRAFSATEGELIFYKRPDRKGPKQSIYSIAPIGNPDALREVMTSAYGQVARVRKIRKLFLAGRTRIHLDRVEGLGEFIELEVVLNQGEPAEAGIKEADDILSRLDIPNDSLVEGAYVDLLKSKEF